jgi:CRISPR-associated protein Csc2
MDLLTEVSAIYQDESQLKSTISTLYQQTKAYAETFGAVAKKAKSNK